MPEQPFRVEQIDHVELFVPDRYEAAKWYENVLGLQIVKPFEDWAGAGGPLMISSDNGGTMLALFEGQPQGQQQPIGIRRIAFRVSSHGFLQLLSRLDAVPVFDAEKQQVTKQDVVDHDKSWSIYFCDPYGNRLEITTYDYQLVGDGLRSKK